MTRADGAKLPRARPGIPRSRERVVAPPCRSAYGCEQPLLLTADRGSICSARATDLMLAWPQLVVAYRRQR
jgi:hypothetical protein